MFEALREQDFRLLFMGQSISLVGSSITTIALAFAVLDISAPHRYAIDYGVVMAAGLVPLLAFLLVGGVWGDRLPRQWVMLVSDVVRFACQAVMAWLLVTHRATIWELVVLQFARGTAEAFFRPAQTGLVPQTVSGERLQQANALRGLSDSLGVTLGAALGGVLVAAIGSGWAIGLDSLSYLASASFLWGLRGLTPVPGRTAARAAADAGLTAGVGGSALALRDAAGEPAGSFVHDLYDGWAEFRSRTWLWVMVAEAAVFHLLIIAPLMVLGPSVAEHGLGGPAAWGAILAAFGVGQIVGGAVGLRLEPARPLLLCGWLTLVEAPLFAFFALGYGMTPLIAAATLCGVSAALVNVLWETTLQEQIPPEALSRVSAFDLMGSLAFYPLGTVVVGPIAAVIGVAGSFAVACGATVASGLLQIALPDIRGVRHRRVPTGATSPAGPAYSGLPVSSHSRYSAE
jgi:MFS family permease